MIIVLYKTISVHFLVKKNVHSFTVLIWNIFHYKFVKKRITVYMNYWHTTQVLLSYKLPLSGVFFRRLPMCGRRGTFWWRLTTSGWSKCTTPSRISRISTSSWSSSLEVSPSSYMYILVLGTVPLICMAIARQLVNTIWKTGQSGLWIH